MVRARRWCLLAAVVLAGCSRSAMALPPSPGFDRSVVTAKANAALRRPGQVVEIVVSTPGFPSFSEYVAADGRMASTINGHPEPSWVSYLFVLANMDRFAARVSRASGVEVTGSYHLGDSSACRTNETIELDEGYLPIRWTTESCDSTKISHTFTIRVVDPRVLPADLFG